MAQSGNQAQDTSREARSILGRHPFLRAPLWQRLLLAGLVGAALGLLLTGQFSATPLWAVVAAGVVPIVVLVEVALHAQARVHARRRQAAEEWAAIQAEIEAWLPTLKADYWMGHHFGRQGLDSSWRWQTTLNERAAALWSGLPFETRVWSRETVRREMTQRTEAAVEADPYWIFYSPQMERSEYVRYCALLLTEYGWTVIEPPPDCFGMVDLVGEYGGTPVLFRCDLASTRFTEEHLRRLAQDARMRELDHAVWVLDGALHHQLRAAAELLGVSVMHHDDLTVLSSHYRALPQVV